MDLLALLLSITGEWFSHRYDAESPNFDPTILSNLMGQAQTEMEKRNLLEFDALGFTQRVYDPKTSQMTIHPGCFYTSIESVVPK